MSPARSLAADERVIVFDTPAHLHPERAQWELRLHAWVFEPEQSRVRMKALRSLLSMKYGLRASSPEEEQNLQTRANWFFADNERGKRIRVEIPIEGLGPRSVEVGPTRPNGHAQLRIAIPATHPPALGPAQLLEVRTRHPRTGQQSQACLHLIPRRGISVISDLDDTFKLSNVRDRRELLANTFLRPFEAAHGMVALYRRWVAQGAVLHFVSSSPWQLYEPIHDFVRAVAGLRATFHLKRVRFKDRTLLSLFEQGLVTKPRQIEPLLLRYPERRFVLVGDSGEQDPEVYAALFHAHGDQIERIYLRNVTGAARDDARFREVFAGVPDERWELFSDPGGLELPKPEAPAGGP